MKFSTLLGYQPGTTHLYSGHPLPCDCVSGLAHQTVE